MENLLINLERAAETINSASLAEDLCSLQEHIRSIREDLCSLAPVNIPGLHLPQAKDELGAVISTTENSANNILDACQVLEDRIRQHGVQGDAVAEQALARIYEACSFQDLTGQRLTKVRRILSMVEERLTSVLIKLGISPDAAIDTPLSAEILDEERALMNGPAMPGQGLGQDDINALFD